MPKKDLHYLIVNSKGERFEIYFEHSKQMCEWLEQYIMRAGFPELIYRLG